MSRLSKRSFVQLAGIGALAAIGALAGCSKEQKTTTTTAPAGTTTTTTTSTTTTTTTTTSTTTTTVPTTTSVPTLTPSFVVQNTPCVAPSTGPASCRFVANATGGEGPYTFNWVFTTPIGSLRVTNQQQVNPEIGCGFSTGARTFNLNVSLTVTDARGTQATTTGTQQMARNTGVCGVV